MTYVVNFKHISLQNSNNHYKFLIAQICCRNADEFRAKIAGGLKALQWIKLSRKVGDFFEF